MANTGYTTPLNKILMNSSPLFLKQELKIETATGCVPGALVRKGTNDDDVVAGDSTGPVIGWLGYEQCHPSFMPDNITSAYAAGAQAPVLSGAGNLLWMPGGLAAGTVAAKGDPLLSWGAKVVPAVQLGGKYAVKIPFAKSTTEKDTGIDLPAGLLITGAMVQVTTGVASSTIDVGISSGEAGGDADGFLDGVSCAATGLVAPIISNTTAASITLGTLLCDVSKSADSPANYIAAPVLYKTDGTAKSITYTTSDHAIAGNILLFVEGPGIELVGRCEKSVSAASAAADIQVRTLR